MSCHWSSERFSACPSTSSHEDPTNNPALGPVSQDMPWTKLGQFPSWKNAISMGSRTRQPLSAATPMHTFLQAELTQKTSAATTAPEQTNPDSPQPAALAGVPQLSSELLFAQALPKKGPWLRSLPGGQAQSGQLPGHRAKNNAELPARPPGAHQGDLPGWAVGASPGTRGRAGESRGSLRSSLLCFLGGFGVVLINVKSCQLSSSDFCSALGSPSSRGLVARSISWREGKPKRTSCYLCFP